MKMFEYQDALKDAIASMHGGNALWIESVPVKEVFNGTVAWDGEVEVFSVHGHPRAGRCFAWGVRRDDEEGWDVTAVLAVPPITTPQLAVRAAIAAYARQSGPPRSQTS